MTGRSRRLFFALWPDEALRRATVAATGRVLAAAGGRAVPSDNLHVTLAFLGNVPEERVAAAIAAGRAVPESAGVQLFDRIVQLGESGPLVLDARRPDPLHGLVRATLAVALVEAGFALDGRPFRPHVTLARKPVHRVPPRPPDAASDVLAWPYAGFVLAESVTGQEGSRYTIVERFAGACRPARPRRRQKPYPT